MAERATGARPRAPWISEVWNRVIHTLERVSVYALLLFLSVLFALPFVWMASTSLKDDPQTYHVPPIWIPNPMRFQNYPEALTFLPFGRYFVNTMQIALPSVLGALVSCTLVAYAFSRIRWPGRDALFFLCLATMMIPFQVRMIPLFLTFKTIGWINTYLPLIVPTFFGDAYFIFMLRQFFLTIPQELSDAARVDGCAELGIFLRIIVPLSKPALAVVGLFQFMWAWNDYLGPLIYLNEEAKYTIALGLQQFRSTFSYQLVWPYLMAASTSTIIPIILLFFFTQRTFVEGITVTGIKG
jgi:multiple sugar transport system permease protein